MEKAEVKEKKAALEQWRAQAIEKVRMVGMEVEIEGDANGLMQVDDGDDEQENWQNMFSFERVCKGLVEWIKSVNELFMMQEKKIENLGRLEINRKKALDEILKELGELDDMEN